MTGIDDEKDHNSKDIEDEIEDAWKEGHTVDENVKRKQYQMQ